MAGAILSTEAHLGMGVIINCRLMIDYHAKVYDFGHLGDNASMSSVAILGPKARMQVGSVLRYGAQVQIVTLLLLPGVAFVGLLAQMLRFASTMLQQFWSSLFPVSSSHS